MTFDDHNQFGKDLYAFREWVMDHQPPYPKSHKPVKSWWKLLNIIDKLRSDMDDKASQDLGDAFSTKLYYRAGMTE